MSEEEKKAIDYTKARIYGNEELENITIYMEDLITILNLIEKQKKQIDLMAKTIKELNNKSDDVDCFIPREYSNINECVKKNSCEECIVEYFKSKDKES